MSQLLCAEAGGAGWHRAVPEATTPVPGRCLRPGPVCPSQCHIPGRAVPPSVPSSWQLPAHFPAAGMCGCSRGVSPGCRGQVGPHGVCAPRLQQQADRPLLFSRGREEERDGKIPKSAATQPLSHSRAGSWVGFPPAFPTSSPSLPARSQVGTGRGSLCCTPGRGCVQLARAPLWNIPDPFRDTAPPSSEQDINPRSIF